MKLHNNAIQSVTENFGNVNIDVYGILPPYGRQNDSRVIPSVCEVFVRLSFRMNMRNLLQFV